MTKALLVAAVLALGLAALPAISEAPAGDPPAASTVVLGTPVVRPLTAGASREERVDLPAGGAFRVAVEQRGIDVTVEVASPDGTKITAVDSPLDRQGTESLLVTPAAAGSYRITVHAREPGDPPAGSYELRIDALALATAEDAAHRDAEAALTRAGELYLEASADSRRRALPVYAEARRAFRAAGDASGEARALYSQAVVSRLVDATAAALPLAREALVLWRALGQPLFAAASENEIGLDAWLSGDREAASAAFSQALAISRAAGDRYGEAVAASNLCLMNLSKGDLRPGLDCYQRALPLLEEVRAGELLGGVLTSIGRAYDALGEPRQARAHYERALERLRATGNRTGEGRTLTNLGVLEAELGEIQAALAHDAAALATFRSLEDRRWQARVLHNLGAVYHGVGELELARSSYEAALALWRQVGDRAGESSTLTNLGNVLGRLGDWPAAGKAGEQALALVRAAGDRRGEGLTLTQVGNARAALGQTAAARAAYEQAAALLAAAGDLPDEGDARRGLGTLDAQAGDLPGAKAALDRALDRCRAAGHRRGEIQTLAEIARTERRLGRLDAARGHAGEALAAIESLRTRIGSPDLRAAYSADSHRTYELAIDLAMAAHRLAPAAGHDREALTLSERARARTLLELLSAAEVHVEESTTSPLLARRRELSERLAAKAERAAAERAAGSVREALNAEQQEILRDLDLLDAQFRATRPEYAALTQPQALSAAEIQALADPASALLVYSLGEEASYLWWVTSGEVASFVLPPRAKIEDLARRLHAAWSGAAAPALGETAGEAAGMAAELAGLLLGPVASRLAGFSRLAVVPDGALAYVPFAALPLPGGTPLLARATVVFLPSASALAIERRRTAGRPAASADRRRALAVFADPVFDPADPRVAPLAGSTASPAGARPSPFERLPGSRREAESIAALTQGGSRVALDFAASRAAVLGDLSGYRVLHFATHGVIDARHPALSGLALSMVDREGHPQEGFLHLRDLYSLRLDADLVVLSGCRTALGREMRGEGLVGLIRGFQYAGAPQVLASLWRVDDQATAELMTAFYRGLWRDGLPAATALRQAQLALYRERRHRDPAFWAAFVLTGDWR